MEHCREDSEMRLRNISVAQKLWSTMAPDLTLSTKAANFCAERCAFGPVVSSEFRKWASMKLRVDSKVTTPQSPTSHEAGGSGHALGGAGTRSRSPQRPTLRRKKPTPTLPAGSRKEDKASACGS